MAHPADVNPDTVEQARPAHWRGRFFAIWGGQQLSWVGSAAAHFGLVWWITTTTGSATVLALGVLTWLLPNVLLGPFAGALVDRWKRRRVMIVADGVVALASAALMALFWAGRAQVWHVYAAMAVRAIGSTFHWPAMAASTPLMVPNEHLPRVAGLNQAVQGAVNILSPAMGALLLKIMPMHGIMAIDVATAAVAVAPLLFVTVPQPPLQASARAATLWADMRAGWAYVSILPGILPLCLMATAINFFANPAFSLTPILVTREFGGDALRLATLNSVFGVGMLGGGLVLAAWGGFRRRIFTIILGVVGMGVSELVVGLAPAFELALGGMFLAAVMNAACNAAANALIQGSIAPQMLGRVITLVGAVTSLAAPLGMAIAGPVADALGVRTLYLAAGATQILVGMAAFMVPSLMHLGEGASAAPHPAEAVAGADPPGPS